MNSPPLLPYGLLHQVPIKLIVLIDCLVKEADGVVGHRLDLVVLEQARAIVTLRFVKLS